MCAYSPTCSVSAINLPNFLAHSNTNTSVGLIVISKLIRHHSKAMQEQGTSLFTSAGVESEGLSEGQSKVVQVRLPEGVRRDRDYIRIHTRTSCFTLLIHAKLNMITSVAPTSISTHQRESGRSEIIRIHAQLLAYTCLCFGMAQCSTRRRDATDITHTYSAQGRLR